MVSEGCVGMILPIDRDSVIYCSFATAPTLRDRLPFGCAVSRWPGTGRSAVVVMPCAMVVAQQKRCASFDCKNGMIDVDGHDTYQYGRY